MMELDQLTYRWSFPSEPSRSAEHETRNTAVTCTCADLAHVEHCMCHDVASIGRGIASTLETKLTHSV
jgi:hypothetical protein